MCMSVSKTHILETEVGVGGSPAHALTSQKDKNQADPPNKVQKSIIQGHKNLSAWWPFGVGTNSTARVDRPCKSHC